MERKIQNIRVMEAILNEGNSVMEELFQRLEKLTAMKEDLEKLFTYYGSEEWFADRDHYDCGDFPKDLSCGVLTEDSIYDLETDLIRLREEVRAFVKEFFEENESLEMEKD